MDCIFCHLNRSILAETKLSLACLDSFPVSKGHALVIPKRHVVSLWEMTTEEYTDAFALVRQVKDVLQEQFHPHKWLAQIEGRIKAIRDAPIAVGDSPRAP